MFPAAKRIVVIGDAHGDFIRVIHCLRTARVIDDSNNWIAAPNTYVVQMGDQVDSKDRVPDNKQWETGADILLLRFMDTLDEAARVHGGRVLSLMGNHELMNMMGDFNYVSNASMTECGGPENRLALFSRAGICGKMLANRYIVVRIGSLLFCHAGILPSHLNFIGENIDELNVSFRRIMSGEVIERDVYIFQNIIVPMTGCLWTRKYMEASVDAGSNNVLKDMLGVVLRTTKCTSMFIGHNTVPNTTVLADGGLIFTDACFSRAYGLDRYQFIDIEDNAMRVVQVQNEI